MRPVFRTVASIGLALAWGPGAVFAQGTSWSPARLLNDLNHTGDIKEPKLWSGRGSGFHAVYRHHGSGAVTVNYVRFEAGTLRPVVQVHSLGFLAGGDICESGDGSLHVVWENWDPVNQQIWWAKSADGGRSFPRKQQVSNYSTNPNGQAKNPIVVPYGPADSPQVLALSWGAAPTDALFYNRYDGTNWGGHTPVGQRTSNFYAAWGAARNPRDGSVWRCYGTQAGGIWQIAMRRFNGVSWDPEVMVSEHTSGFSARPTIAINQAGQIMVAWDNDETVWARMRDPVTGWGPQTRVDEGAFAALTAIPGRNDFYLAYSYPRGALHQIVGRRWANGVWSERVRIMHGIPDAYSVNADLAADLQGNLYCAWEYWDPVSGKPRAWFSILSNRPPAVLVSPTNLQGFLAPASILLSATNSDPSLVLSRVEFLQDGVKVGERTSAPFSLMVSNLPAGRYGFSVVGTATSGASGTSAVVTVTVVAGIAVTLVPTGSVWRYLDTGATPPPTWTLPGFNDAAWPSGRAQLGFGDGDEATVINTNRLRITTYFRHSFVLPYAGAVKALMLRLLRDDGAVGYLNGTEIFRSNMPAQSDASTLALYTVAGAEENQFFDFVVDPSLLVVGTNVLAVEVHQATTNSSDLSFDLELTALRAYPAATRLQASIRDRLMRLAWASADSFVLQMATNLSAPIHWHPAPVSVWVSNVTHHAVVPIEPGTQRYYRLRWAP